MQFDFLDQTKKLSYKDKLVKSALIFMSRQEVNPILHYFLPEKKRNSSGIPVIRIAADSTFNL